MRIVLDFGSILEDSGISGTFIVALEKPLILSDRIVPANLFETVPIADGTGEIDLVASQGYGIFYTSFLNVGGRRIWNGRFQVPPAGTNLKLSQLLKLTPTLPPGAAPDSAPTALMGLEYTAAQAMSAWRVVRVRDGDRLEYASSSNTIHAYGVLGILPRAVNQNETVAPIVTGPIEDQAWNWNPNAPIWLGIDGQLTQTAPAIGFLLQVATPITPTQIQFEIQEPTLL